MITVKFLSLDQNTRVATFDVNGDIEARKIADGVGQDMLKSHLVAMAEGLVIEYKARTAPAITSDPFSAEQVIITEQAGL